MTDPRPTDPALPFHPCRSVELTFFDDAPCRFVNTVRLPVSAQRLFEVFEDPMSWPRWAPGIGSVTWTSEKPFRPGTTRTVRFWGGMAVYEDFFVYDPPREMAFRFYGTSERLWDGFAERYQVVAVDDRSCELTWTVAYDASNWIGSRPVRLVMSLNFRLYMRLLRRYCRKLAS